MEFLYPDNCQILYHREIEQNLKNKYFMIFTMKTTDRHKTLLYPLLWTKKGKNPENDNHMIRKN